MRRRLSSEQIREIRERRRNLEPTRSIAQDLGISPASVSKHSRRLRKCREVVTEFDHYTQPLTPAPDGVIAWLSNVTEWGAKLAKLRAEMDELVRRATALRDLMNGASE